MDVFFESILKSQIFLTIHPWDLSWSMRADRQTDNRMDTRIWRRLQSISQCCEHV